MAIFSNNENCVISKLEHVGAQGNYFDANMPDIENGISAPNEISNDVNGDVNDHVHSNDDNDNGLYEDDCDRDEFDIDIHECKDFNCKIENIENFNCANEGRGDDFVSKFVDIFLNKIIFYNTFDILLLVGAFVTLFFFHKSRCVETHIECDL